VVRWEAALFFPVMFFATLIAAIIYIAARHFVFDERK
jgi:hypothetical protein